MESNQTAAEIAREYEAMACESANKYCKLRMKHPGVTYPALASHVSFCTLMQFRWMDVARVLEKGNTEWGLM